jgi:Icc-related predicted phosphoesterase
MRLHLYSDLHLEFGPIEFPEEVKSGGLAELVLLAGDINMKRRAVKWAASTFSQPIAMIGGNHESYQDSFFAMIADNRKQAGVATQARGSPIRYLERESWHLTAHDGTSIRILGATLWTDFALLGPGTRDMAMAHAQEHANDYLYIKIRKTRNEEKCRLSPADTSAIHHQTRKFLETELRQPFDGVSIVMTHHAPSAESLPPADRMDLSAPCYASALDNFIEEFQPDLWVHGHVHISNDYRIGRTRIVSNPRGYVPNHRNPDFDPASMIEI